MSVGRLNEMPERALERSLADASRLGRELKGSDQIIGSASLSFTVSETANQFDWQGILSKRTGSGFGYEEFIITLTSAIAEIPLVETGVKLFYSPNGTTWQEYSMERGLSEGYTGVNPQISRWLEPLQGLETEPYKATYFMSVYGQPDARVGLKVQANGTDELDINVVRVV